MIPGIQQSAFQATIDGKQTDLYTLKNNNGMEVAITNYGAAIIGIYVPDKNGNFANVIGGHDSIEAITHSSQKYLSTTIGRYGNRIKGGKFVLNGKQYQLPQNEGNNTLHGGMNGFNKKVWDALQMNDQTIVLNYTSPYGEEGFTGEMKVTVIYSLTEENELCIEYLAKTNKTTIIALTNHAFFSLGGIKNPTDTIDNQLLELNADFYLPVDTECIPTGEILKVEGTPFDFRKPKAIGLEQNADHEQIKNGSGYDHNFVLNKREEGELSFAARLTEPESGRTLEVYTTEPGCQFYADNFVRDIVGPEGATFPRRSAVCLETQHFPDSPNRNYFPSVVLRPGERYKSKTIYKFGVTK
ncbi:MAG: galactose mutarotase [Prevotella sp.]|nr:galactose mutarotase [Prevotella sp.]MCF0208161.1 galactose mutarotase [Bacteroidaceae bacterium]